MPLLLNLGRFLIGHAWRGLSWLARGLGTLLNKPWAQWLGFVALSKFSFDTVKEKVDDIIGYISNLVVPGGTPDSSGLHYYLNMCNTFFPLSELFTFIVLYFGFILWLIGYRIAKSWINKPGK